MTRKTNNRILLFSIIPFIIGAISAYAFYLERSVIAYVILVTCTITFFLSFGVYGIFARGAKIFIYSLDKNKINHTKYEIRRDKLYKIYKAVGIYVEDDRDKK